MLITRLRPYRRLKLKVISSMIVFGLLIGGVMLLTAPRSAADKGQRLITIHDNGRDHAILSSAKTLRQAFVQAGVPFGEHDLVEPNLDAELVAPSYEVNIYRARPVTVVDGMVRQKIITPYRTPKQIAAKAGVPLRDEDRAHIGLAQATARGSVDNGEQLIIDRATEVKLDLYGKVDTVYTQAETVGQMLDEKKIRLAANDKVSYPSHTPIRPGLTLRVWREGKQTVTIEEEVPFTVERVEDANRDIGYHAVTTPGVAGKRNVTYEITIENGREVSRREIQSVILLQPQRQVEVVGAKPSFSGDFAAALAQLRSCEGGYNSWNPAGPYYGAYQFAESTWYAYAPRGADYGNATPAEQDQAARNLYVARGWSPWPTCGAGLPDAYR